MLQEREAFESDCRAAYLAAAAEVSIFKSQLQVSDALRGRLGLCVHDEYRYPKSGYSIDMPVRGAGSSTMSAGAADGSRSWAVEFDGPSHFLACGSPLSCTLLKHRHLRLLGYALVVVPYWECDQISGDKAAEVEYLQGKFCPSSVGDLLAGVSSPTV